MPDSVCLCVSNNDDNGHLDDDDKADIDEKSHNDDCDVDDYKDNNDQMTTIMMMIDNERYLYDNVW